MLGFTAFSQTPISQSTTALFAQAFMPGTAAQFSAGDLLLEAIANPTLASVSASTNVNVLFDAQASTAISDVTASFSINDLLDVDAQAGTTPTGATASFSINTFAEVDAQALITFPDISATFTADTIAFDAKAGAAIAG